jgi:ketosteroid isomerase-like protein
VSRENVKLAQDIFAAYNRGGIERALEYVDPNAELVAPPNWPEEPVLRGHAGVSQVWAGWEEQFGGFRLDLERVLDAGDHGVLALFNSYFRITGSEREIVQPQAIYVEFIEGKITRWQAYLSWEEALKAVRLEE